MSYHAEWREKFHSNFSGFPKISAVMKELSAIKPKSVLDIGCGDGELLSCIEHFFDKTVGIDADVGMVQAAKKRLIKSKIYLGHADDLSMFKDKSFDCVVTTFLLEHVVDLQKTLREIERISRTQIHLVPNSPFNKKDYLDPTHQRHFGYFGWKRTFKSARIHGLKDSRVFGALYYYLLPFLAPDLIIIKNETMRFHYRKLCL